MTSYFGELSDQSYSKSFAGSRISCFATGTDVQVVLLLLGWLRGIWDWGSSPLLTNFFFMWVFQWFFISSVRLGKSPAIRDHLHSFTGQSILKFSSKLSLPFQGNWIPLSRFILNISAYEKGNWLNKQSWSTYLLVTEAWRSAHLLLKRSTKASDRDACSLSIWACSFSGIAAALQLENHANIASSYSLIPLKN